MDREKYKFLYNFFTFQYICKRDGLLIYIRLHFLLEEFSDTLPEDVVVLSEYVSDTDVHKGVGLYRGLPPSCCRTVRSCASQSEQVKGEFIFILTDTKNL